MLFTATYIGAIYVLYTYLAPLLEASQGFGRDGVALALLVFGVGAIAGNLLGGALADRIGSSRTLALACLAQALTLWPFSLLPLSVPALLLLTLAWSTCGWSFMVAQQTRVVAQTPERQGVVLALNAAAIYVGAAAGSAAGAAVIGAFGLDALGTAAAFGALLALGHLVLGDRLAAGRAGGATAAAVPAGR